MATTSSEIQVFDCLAQTQAQLQQQVSLGNGTKAAIWQRQESELTRYQRPGHHTLSCYLTGGQGIRRLYAQRSQSGGGPGRICLMPSEHDSNWEVNGPIQFLHLYFSDTQLRALAEKIQDKDMGSLALQDLTFIEDRWISQLCQQLIMPLNWRDNADQLALASASDMLMVHLLKHYCHGHRQMQWEASQGGLAPYALRRILDYIDSYLEQPLTLAELAGQIQLSEYHFARQFKVSMGTPPHQYVMAQRLQRAAQLLRQTEWSLAEVALACGFSSQSHFSQRFKAYFSVSPLAYRKAH
ncbi:AraC family transcriptional regulator [Bacterioplanes sanyensis]|uniref:helix-turn-helix domain-containing protein n=1 Tax=Bacterioplanes sanyensis TaxID=1249553 RepID=UPI0016757020|nr:AraC family transcriptional regulator [Bacterioplanes sanyensis]GGY31865.1 AraC family transcriptional regulator [Bacterioplanes sanyensis]